MSIAEIERFATDLNANEALRVEAGKAEAEKSHGTPMDRAVAFAISKGYDFTADEARQHAKARAKAKGNVLTDAELDGLAGGYRVGDSAADRRMCSIRTSLCTGGIAGARPGRPDGF
ncbi:MAG: hypothetical protein Q8N31_13195 [Reyranella sp.]|nr:hypothetical protein [Reyranella sp.]MDP3160969.1 hypothetical protein [Reyranella sp.]